MNGSCRNQVDGLSEITCEKASFAQCIVGSSGLVWNVIVHRFYTQPSATSSAVVSHMIVT